MRTIARDTLDCPTCSAPTIAITGERKMRFCYRCQEELAIDTAPTPAKPTEATQKAPKRKQIDSAVELANQLWLWAQEKPGRVMFCTEYVFHPTRKWRFDVAFPDQRLAVEVDGGNRMAIITKSGHPVAVGEHTQAEDYQKMNEAVLLGWRVLRFLPVQVKCGEALAMIEKALA